MPIISISRGTKSGGLELAVRLSERLGYKTLSREEVISESARKFNVMEEFLRLKLDKTPGLWQKFTDEYRRYICFIQCALLEAVKQDNVIYHGHAGQFLLKGLRNVLRLRVTAPLEYRTRAAMAEMGCDRAQAVRYIEKVDEERRRWVKMVYGQDWGDPGLYDMCVNLEHMSMDTICDVVATALVREDFRSSEESRRALNNRALQCNVEAALSSVDRIWHSNHQVTVSAHDGLISLRGVAKNRELTDLIVETAGQVKGVVDCRSEITLLSEAFR